MQKMRLSMHIVAIGTYSMVSCQLFQEKTLQERINLTCLISLCILFFKFYLLINSSSLLLCYGSCTHLDARLKKKKHPAWVYYASMFETCK